MKIILLHGDNWTKISDRLTKFVDVAKTRGWRIERIDSNANFNFREKLSSISLFDEEKLFIVDNIKSLKKKDIDWLKKDFKKLSGNLILASSNTLSKTVINSFPKFDKIELYEIPKKIWSFLDSVYPGNYKLSLKLLHEVLESVAPELIIFLLSRYLKDLYIALVSPESLSYEPWRIRKLTSQAGKFSKVGLKKVINLLARADYAGKTGESDLVSALDLIIVSQLE